MRISSVSPRFSFVCQILLSFTIIYGLLIPFTTCQFSIPTNFTILSTNITSYTSLSINVAYSPSQSIMLLKIPSSQSFKLIFKTKLSNSSQSYQMVDSHTIKYNEQTQFKSNMYNLEPNKMAAQVQLVYQKYYYLNIDGSVFVDGGINQQPILNSTVKIDVKQQVLESFVMFIDKVVKTRLEKDFLSIIEKSKTTNYMLPFNFISLKKYKVFVNYFDQQIQKTSYANQPFLPTFWNQLGSESIIVPWLPYFSECTGQKKRIMMQDLLKPKECINIQDYSNKKSFQVFNQVQCSTKILSYSCLIEQQSVSNPKRSQWYHSPEKDIFYFHPQSVEISQLDSYLQNAQVLDSISQQMYQQRPVLFTNNLNILEKPKEFIFHFNMGIDKGLNQEILSVSLEVNSKETLSVAEHPDYQKRDNQVKLHVKVKYYTDWQKFVNLHFGYEYYLLIPILASFTMYITCFLLEKNFKKFRNYRTKKLFSLVMIPLIKGLFLSASSMFLFMVLFYLISKQSSFQIIATTFNGDDTIKSDLYRKYNGRNGLVMVISGFFILIQSIKQTFKIPTPQQMKISIQDAQEQNQQLIQLNESMQKGSKNQIQEGSRSLSKMNDINFAIKTLQSRRNKIFLEFAFVLIGLEYNYKFSTFQTSKYIEIILWLGVFPIVITVCYKIMCHILIKDLLYAKATITIFQTHFYCISLLKSDTIWDLGFYLTVSIISFALFVPFYQIKLNSLCNRLCSQQNPNFIQLQLLKYCKGFIKNQSSLSHYQKGLYFSSIFISQIAGVLLTPFLFLLLLWSFQDSKIFSDVFVNSYNFMIIFMVSVMEIPLIIYGLLITMETFDKYYDLGMFKVIELNHFNFSNRKVKWMSDIFRQNPTIKDYLKEFEKFHFSSQLYFILFSFQFAGITMIIGYKIIIENQYICFVDPALMAIFIIIWLVGDILAMIISFLALKLKFYEKKQQVRMRTKLQTIQSHLTKKQYNKYLDLDAVKQYFLFTHKTWVIKNIEKVLTKSMFMEQNGKMLKKFKFYKNLLKRKSIMMKRSSFSMGNRRVTQFYKDAQSLQKGSQRQLQQPSFVSPDETGILVNGRLSPANSLSSQPKVIKISKHKFHSLAKPILYSWFYTAKQNIMLKSLVHKVKQEKLFQVCEFCNMDLDLQNIQKHEIQQIINKYRVINVGKAFVPNEFIEYYRTFQEFITVCFQCKEKKLYLQKKRIKNIKYAKIIVMNWMIRCRAKMLQACTNKVKITRDQ